MTLFVLFFPSIWAFGTPKYPQILSNKGKHKIWQIDPVLGPKLEHILFCLKFFGHESAACTHDLTQGI